MGVRVLATGDIHIGRRPTRVPEVEAERASAARMWEAIVSRAIALRVDAVLLSGDIVDHDNRFFEATGPLERGILRLADADIPTFAVAGNHDWDVFPRILDQLNTPMFHFIGRGGDWEETYLERDGERLLRVIGWSFPSRHFRQNPLQEFSISSESRIPTVGLLHADVDASASEYAPVPLADLQARDVALWVMGHVHKPQYWPSNAGTLVLYPGSPQALSPSESGPHGPWLVDLDGPHSVSCQQLVMSRVRYEEREVDLASADTPEAFDAHINESLVRALEELNADDDPPESLVLRLSLIGSTPLCGRIDSLAKKLHELERSRGGVQARIDKYANLTRPAVDLVELSRRNDPCGTLARTLVALERGNEEGPLAELLVDATTRLQDVQRATAYSPLVEHDPKPDRRAARDILLQQGRQLLEALRMQLPESKEEPA